MTKEEKHYIMWYDGKTFNTGSAYGTVYTLAEFKFGRVYVRWDIGKTNTGYGTYTLKELFRYIREGSWIIND